MIRLLCALPYPSAVCGMGGYRSRPDRWWDFAEREKLVELKNDLYDFLDRLESGSAPNEKTILSTNYT